jgi:hypothetical protein
VATAPRGTSRNSAPIHSSVVRALTPRPATAAGTDGCGPPQPRKGRSCNILRPFPFSGAGFEPACRQPRRSWRLGAALPLPPPNRCCFTQTGPQRGSASRRTDRAHAVAWLTCVGGALATVPAHAARPRASATDQEAVRWRPAKHISSQRSRSSLLGEPVSMAALQAAANTKWPSRRHVRRRRRTVQFSSARPSTRSNSAVLFVTSVSPSALAWAAMNRSLAPIIAPRAFSVARIRA